MQERHRYSNNAREILRAWTRDRVERAGMCAVAPLPKIRSPPRWVAGTKANKAGYQATGVKVNYHDDDGRKRSYWMEINPAVTSTDTPTTSTATDHHLAQPEAPEIPVPVQPSLYTQNKEAVKESWSEKRDDLIHIAIQSAKPPTTTCYLCEEEVPDGCLQPYVCSSSSRQLIMPHQMNCYSSSLKSMRVFDQNGRLQYLDVAVCPCETELETLLKLGLWGATPTKPQTAFSVSLLEWLVWLSREAQVSTEAFCRAVRWKNNLTLDEACKFKECGLEMAVLLFHKEDGVSVIGTPKGRDFLKDQDEKSALSLQFVKAVNDGNVPLPPASASSKSQLAKEVRSMLNEKYVAAGNKGKFPYKTYSAEEGGITVHGLPEGTSVRHIASLGKEGLQRILQEQDKITVEVHSTPANSTSTAGTSSTTGATSTSSEPAPQTPAAVPNPSSPGASSTSARRATDTYHPVEALLDKRVNNSQTEYLVHWAGYDVSDSSWEPEHYIPQSIRDHFEEH
ncbi:hypothetical protein Bbelb_155130 [Branchiostoma belcheri]|nr:hypothetical protein Bbelb_155130 [Branchiostoma belcheri]